MPGSELLAWSISLRSAFYPPGEDVEETAREAPSDVLALLNKLAQQLDELLLRQARVEDRLAALDANT
jgi:hypothetical protein